MTFLREKNTSIGAYQETKKIENYEKIMSENF